MTKSVEVADIDLDGDGDGDLDLVAVEENADTFGPSFGLGDLWDENPTR